MQAGGRVDWHKNSKDEVLRGNWIRAGVYIPSTTKNHHFCRLPIIYIQGFIIGTYKNDGYGSQWYRFIGLSRQKQQVVKPTWNWGRLQLFSSRRAC